MTRWLAIGLLLVGTSQGTWAAEKQVAVGARIPDVGTLRDLRGSARGLHGFKGDKATVLVFLGTDCPVANLYLPTLLQTEKRYRERGVQFLAVYPHENENLDRIAAHAYDHGIPFPVLKDPGQKLAMAAGIERVPTVVVLNQEMSLQYRGRIDDRYGVSHRREKATRADLAEALDDVLTPRPVRVSQTDADGCLIDRHKIEPSKSSVTYTKHVAPIVQSKCQGCHRPGQTAPFALMSYEDAARRGAMIREVTSQRRMPPWHADGRYGKFANDRRLSDAEIDTLTAWVDGGMPRGKDEDAPKPITRPDGWTVGKPDMVIPMPESFDVPADGSLPYKHWVVDPGFTEDKWVRIAEGRPENPGVVHHLVVYILRPGTNQPFQQDGTLSILVGWAPGDLGTICPPDTALRIPKGSKLRFEMHYTPNGKAVKDRSAVGITFADKPPKFEYFTNSFANESILLPPFDPHYRAEATWRLPADARILSFVPHMHWRGKDYRYEVIYPDGKRETILSVPRYDFNWQNVYQLKEPLRLPKGAKLHAVAHWDNSRNNPYNPAPEKQVRFGLQTWDEMMVGWVAYVWERPETAAELAKKTLDADMFFDRLDRNGDDVITANEIPDQLKPFMKLNNIEVPDRISREQFKVMFEEMRKRFQRPTPKKP